MTYGRRPRLFDRQRADLAKRRAQFVDIQIDQIGGPVIAERANRPQK